MSDLPVKAETSEGPFDDADILMRLRAMISELSKKDKPWNGAHTPESIAKIRAPQLGKPKSEETKARMRRPKSESHKKKLREINLGKTHNEETRKRLSEIAKADWARRKAQKALEIKE